jgi:hypothetical protein
MGGTVTSLSPTQAEETSARLRHGVRGGLPLMIPGAWELRARRPIVQAIDTGAPGQLSHAAGSGTDRERLERALEGGGAPSQRRRPQRMILAKVWRYIVRSTDAPLL